MINQLRILAIFYLQPIALGAWLPRLPEIQSKLGLDFSALSIALLGAPVGILVTLLFAGRLAALIGAKKVIFIFYPLFLGAMILPLIAPTLPLIFGALFIMGAMLSILELGLNITADELERDEKTLIMNKAHGFWSLGLMTGSFAGSYAASHAFSPVQTGLLIAGIVLPLALPLTHALPDQNTVPDTKNNETQLPPSSGAGFSLPHPILLGICFFAMGTTLAEGAVADWAAIFLVRIFSTGPGEAGLGVTIFALLVALMRLAGDHLKKKFGGAPLARALALIGFLGVTIVFMAPSAYVAMFGFALVGVGVSLAFPLAVTAAAAAPGPDPARNVALLSFIALLGFLIGPVSIGFVAQNWTIRFGLLVLAPMLGLSALLAPLLAPVLAAKELAPHPSQGD